MKLVCRSTDPIFLIKTNLREKMNIPSDQMILLTLENNGEKQELDAEEKTLADYNAKNGSTLELTSFENRSNDENQ